MKTLVWDVDDVLCPTMESWLEQTWRPGRTQAPAFAALTENPPHRLLGVDRETYHQSLDAFRSESYSQMVPFPEITAFFADHGRRFHHVALTATPRAHAPTVARWVLTHFGDWIRTFGFVPSARPGDEECPCYHPDKGAWLRDFGGVDLYLDDSPKNVALARIAGVESRVVRQPWNDGVPLVQLLETLARDL